MTDYKSEQISGEEEKYLNEIEIRALLDQTLSRYSGNIVVAAGSISGTGTEPWSLTPSDMNIKLGENSEQGIQGWANTMTFSATDDDTVEWTSGSITLTSGKIYSIVAGNTGTMSAITYIYLDVGTSETVLQTTTTAASTVGSGKILVGVAQNNDDATSDATFQIFGGSGGVLLTTENLAANSITANELTANSVTATEINVSQLSAISANMGSITAGTITGATIQTASSGRRVKVSTDQYIRWYNGSDVEAYIWNNTSGHLVIDADSTIDLVANGSGDDIVITAGDDFGVTCRDTWFACSGNWQINECDSFIVNYNDDNSGDQVYFNEDSGLCFNLDTGKDGYIHDDFEVGGNLSKDGGSFKIDHPLKPKTHYLFHSFVESPDMLNIYKGRGKLKNGKYTIKLPDYFEVLNKDIEYNLTPVGKQANLWISKEENNFEIEVSGDVDCEFSWVVYGVRQDPWAEENRIQVEVEKKIEGYKHPELYDDDSETQNLADKITSLNYWRRKEKKETYLIHNTKGRRKMKKARFKKFKSKLSTDVLEDMNKVKEEKKQQEATKQE